MSGRVVIVSNRLPFTVRAAGDTIEVAPSAGGLATGLRGVHARSGGLWIGWSGLAGAISPAARIAVRRQLAASGAASVELDADEVAAYYCRFANGVLWPLLHDRVVDLPAWDDWATYRAVNARFADVVARHLRPGDHVWVHDFHLMLVPRLLRERVPDARIGFFLHTPFPETESLAALPQRAALIDGLLGADLVGFHTAAYAARFMEAAEMTLGRPAHATTVDDGGRRVHVRACPMSVDASAFAARAAEPQVTAAASALRRDGTALLLGVDRLDYTKGIPERLSAYARLLERRPDLHGAVRLHQLAVPSRENVPAYQALRADVERRVAAINARFGTPEWTPIEYVYGTVDDAELSALYRAADVMLVTPLRDGMNLVAKEFVASRADGDGVLVLGERAGAAAELRASLLVDPRDADALASAIERALSMSPAERRVRMRRLRAVVQRHDVYQWAREFLVALGSRHAAAVGRAYGGA